MMPQVFLLAPRPPCTACKPPACPLQVTLTGTHRVGIPTVVGTQQASSTPSYSIPQCFVPSGLYQVCAEQGNRSTEGCTLVCTSAAAQCLRSSFPPQQDMFCNMTGPVPSPPSYNILTSFSASFNSASFSFTRMTNICLISSSFFWSSPRNSFLLAS